MIRLILILSLLSTIAIAEPLRCPLAFEIKARGLSTNLLQDAQSKWYAGRSAEKYKTPQKWTFIIGGFEAGNEKSAFALAYEALLSLEFNSGPIEAPAHKFVCFYDNDADFSAGAVTPPLNDMEF